jgi:hypothetical protein
MFLSLTVDFLRTAVFWLKATVSYHQTVGEVGLHGNGVVSDTL